MDASGAVYYPPFPNDDNDQGGDPKRCSVRGCPQLVTDGSQNKMCDSCRGRHRIYASTKRARRKLEKAAVTNAVAARNGLEHMLLVHESSPVASTSPSAWVPPSVTGQRLPEDISPSSSHQASATSTTSTLQSSWNHAIDPLLYTPGAMTSSHHLPPHQTSSSSELANALTLPTPRVVKQPEQASTRQGSAEQPREPSPSEVSSTQESSQIEARDAYVGSLRFCSVKGCKAALAVSYGFKMCPSCRTRYRTYGHTKRAKWKTEREAFDQEMSTLRELEDERRKANGLGPLADNPEELRAWELSIIDEQVPVPLLGPPPMASLSPPPNDQMDFGQHIASGSMHPANFDSPMITAGVYPATVGSIDTPHSVSPYPHLNNPLLTPMTGPIAARMCTVSHCHKILPGYYRYKRCEQHRMQNRYHSNLKRVREKQVKAAGVDASAEGLVIVDGISGDKVEGSADPKPKPKRVPKERKPRKDRKDKGKPRDAPNSPMDSVNIANEASEAPSEHSDAHAEERTSTNISIPNEDQEKTEAKPREKSRKRTRHSCSTENCYNLLTPGVRWRTCEECRNADRIRKMEVRAEVKAVENVLWKELAQQMSAARRAGEEGAGTGVPDGGAPVASGSGSGAANAPEVSSSTSMDIYADADADGDSEHGDDENREKERAQVAVAVVDTYPTQLPTWRTKKAPSTSTEPIFNSLTKEDYEKPAKPPLQTSGFSKFRVELPPSAPGAPPSSFLMSDPLAFKGFKPTTTTAAIGRILASNPGISVDVFTNLLDAQKSKSTTTSSSESGPQLRATVPVAKPVPTPTIPTSEPFVYKAPVKKAPPVPVPVPAPASEENATTPSTSASTSNKGKRKATTQKEPETLTSTAPARTTPASASTPLPTSYGPYGYPPSYPYYPYYMPPYPMSPYAYPPSVPIPPESSKKGSSSSATASSSSTPAAPSYYPYPYPPQPYGFPPPPPTGYPYLPPRYTTAAYGQATSQQPYPGQPPYSGQQAYPGFAAPTGGYPYYLPPPASSVSAPIAIATPAVLPNGTGVKPVKPPSGKNPSSEFSYYRPKVTEEEGADKPRKRRKVDPDFLEKYKAQTQAISLSLAKDAEKLATTSAVPPLPPALSTLVVASVPAVTPTAPISAPPTSSAEETTELTQPQASESAQSSGRPCATKTCHRKIPVAVGGTICEKCKLRFKKHQAKTKQKFKLEPRKFVLGREANGKMEDSQDGVDGEPVTS